MGHRMVIHEGQKHSSYFSAPLTLIPKMEAVGSSKLLATTYKTMQCLDPRDNSLNLHHHDHLISYVGVYLFNSFIHFQCRTLNEK
jgi:hypothetical protein